MFFTGVLAFVSASYACYTIFDSVIPAVLFGLIWGLMIFNLDRYLVSSMRKSDSFWSNLVSASPRILLAVMIAIVISKPLEVKVFESEILSEIEIMQQERYLSQEQIARSRFQPDIDAKKNRILALEVQLDSEKKRVESLLNEAIAEADGTGGSQMRNMGPIYRMKKKEADAAQREYLALKDSLAPVLAGLSADLAVVESRSDATIAEMNETLLTGLASRIEALGRLSQKSPVILWASIFITLLFIAIECSPILVKLITKKGPYDHMLVHLESKYQSKAERRMALSALTLRSDLDYATKTQEAQNAIRIDAENTVFGQLVQQTTKDILSGPVSWADYKDFKAKLHPEN